MPLVGKPPLDLTKNSTNFSLWFFQICEHVQYVASLDYIIFHIPYEQFKIYSIQRIFQQEVVHVTKIANILMVNHTTFRGSSKNIITQCATMTLI
jgi:hypothetical protein